MNVKNKDGKTPFQEATAGYSFLTIRNSKVVEYLKEVTNSTTAFLKSNEAPNLSHPFTVFNTPFLMARWAELTTLTRECQEVLMATVVVCACLRIAGLVDIKIVCCCLGHGGTGNGDENYREHPEGDQNINAK